MLDRGPELVEQVDIDLWTVISTKDRITKIWYRFGDKPPVRVYKSLRPDIESLSADDRLVAQDIIDSYFSPFQAQIFLRELMRLSMGTEHRMVSIHQPGIRTIHERLWHSQDVDEFWPFGDGEPFMVSGVEFGADKSLGSWNLN
jgi:RNA recognition motif-containing protein